MCHNSRACSDDGLDARSLLEPNLPRRIELSEKNRVFARSQAKQQRALTAPRLQARTTTTNKHQRSQRAHGSAAALTQPLPSPLRLHTKYRNTNCSHLQAGCSLVSSQTKTSEEAVILLYRNCHY